MTLDRLEIDRRARIHRVDAHNAVILRLMEMGLVPGVPVRVKNRAPFGGPLQLAVGDYLLSIRSTEAAAFSIEPEP